MLQLLWPPLYSATAFYSGNMGIVLLTPINLDHLRRCKLERPKSLHPLTLSTSLILKIYRNSYVNVNPPSHTCQNDKQNHV